MEGKKNTGEAFHIIAHPILRGGVVLAKVMRLVGVQKWEGLTDRILTV